MQEKYTEKFYHEWKVGFNLYLEGKWEEALPQLTLASNLGPDGYDGPCHTLIDYIEKHYGRAPIDWKGYRPFEG